MSILAKIQSEALTHIQEAQAEQAQLDQYGRSSNNDFKLDVGAAALIEALPGDADWGRAAVYALPRNPTNDQVSQWVGENAKAQLRAMEYKADGSDAPEWAITRPTTYPGHVAIPTLFLGAKGIENTGSIDYSEYPAKVLTGLPEDHPRKIATKMTNKFGNANKPQTQIFMNVLVVPTNDRGQPDDAAYDAMIRTGGFIKVMRLSSAQYAKLRDLRDVLSGMDIPSISHVRLHVKKGKDKEGFTFTQLKEARWRKTPAAMRAVMQELDAIGSLRERSGVRVLDDGQFAKLLADTLATSSEGPAA